MSNDTVHMSQSARSVPPIDTKRFTKSIQPAMAQIGDDSVQVSWLSVQQPGLLFLHAQRKDISAHMNSTSSHR